MARRRVDRIEGRTVSARTIIANERGLHARAAAKLVRVAEKYHADITVSVGGQTVSARSIMGLLMLAAVKGTEVTIAASGENADAAAAEIIRLIDESFEEQTE